MVCIETRTSALASDSTVQVGKLKADVGTGRIRSAVTARLVEQLRQLRDRRSWLSAPATVDRLSFGVVGGAILIWAETVADGLGR